MDYVLSTFPNDGRVSRDPAAKSRLALGRRHRNLESPARES